jgi:hypothetical protein
MSKLCQELHTVLNSLPRYSFPFEKDKIFKNGIYILFEKEEYAHDGDRIVRIGTHNGDNNLYNRLKEHFINENKDRSIFRKNIGRAILNKNNDSYLDIWEIDFQERKNKELYGNKLDDKKQKEIEKAITKYIRENLSFCLIEVPDKKHRLYYESKLISTISSCEDCKSSKEWLGNYSPKEKIVNSSLWLVNELYKEPFNEKELKLFIDKYINKNLI